jgi:hypothetical protein
VTARAVISIEVELAWGFHDTGDYTLLSEGRTAETETLEALLELCDELGVEISFDVVDHLLHERCDGHVSPHDDGWFDADPETGVDTDPLFYAPDLVQRVQEASVDHEICSHTFSHVLCDQVTEEQLAWELSESRRIRRAVGVEAPEAVVPPRHRVAHRSVFRENGIDCLRRPFRRYGGTEKPPKSTRLRWSLEPRPPVGGPQQNDGLVEVRCHRRPTLTSPLLPNGRRAAPAPFTVVPATVRKWYHRRYLREGLKKAVASDSSVCYWTHLSNMANEMQFSVISGFLRELDTVSSETPLKVSTFADVVAAVR